MDGAPFTHMLISSFIQLMGLKSRLGAWHWVLGGSQVTQAVVAKTDSQPEGPEQPE